ncbi:hypothetical protein CIPAW_01G123700 [Carya illinoinensis]|uniref:Retrovirus-related Pol polyprotein from transposon TNT 1-94-like beta-barrel domain-containing protein n=1 Tax=Carya illinoinensis TaxID=32201 RepID=A0A8T1RKU2_CARIL|nr:hypothetical protein CIPAW_01G123700 [Carya illinoinensis]
MDSTYHNHKTPSSSLFSKIHSAHPPLVINTTNGSTMLAPNIGSISTSNISISEVLHIPKLYYNLMYVGELAQLGNHIIFYYSGCTMQDPWIGQALGIGHRVERMFLISTLHLPSIPLGLPIGVSSFTSVSPSFTL